MPYDRQWFFGANFNEPWAEGVPFLVSCGRIDALWQPLFKWIDLENVQRTMLQLCFQEERLLVRLPLARSVSTSSKFRWVEALLFIRKCFEQVCEAESFDDAPDRRALG